MYILGWSILNFNFFISFWHLKIVCEMKKKKFSKNLHDVKKDLGLATGDYDDFNSTIILFVLS